MANFNKYNIKPIIDEKNPQQAKFTISPLEKGIGTTIGNALRRTLLFDIPGAALFAIKVNNATHEFQPISGVKEDISQIILNLKGVVFTIDENAYTQDELDSLNIEQWPVMEIKASGKTVIHASDIKLPAGFSVINKDVYICELTDEKANLNISLYATRGHGFKPFSVNREKINTLSLIAVDSDFNPIVRANYTVDEIKLSKYETGDTLTMEVSTNGSISPSNAIAYAAKVLSEHLQPLIDIDAKIKEYVLMNEQAQTEKKRTLSIPIENINLSIRSYNCLKRAGIQTIQELTNKTRSEVEHIKNLGRKSLREIQKRLTEYGLTFADEVPSDENAEDFE